MTSFNYFFTPVGPEYKKKFARNVGIVLLVLFVFYVIWNLIIDEVVSEHSMTFSAGNMTFHEELCIKNEGKWVDYQHDSKCYFETYTKYKLAEIAFHEAGKTKIIGDVAKKICIILDIPCPKDPKFDAWYDRDENIATFTYYKNKERFTFIIEETEIKYRSDASQNEWKIFDDNILERFQDQPEVEAFYTTYPDALEKVQDDHISYFAGSEDDYHVRMNMFFDENYELDHIDFHCYFQREHQFEFPQEDIVTKIEKYECKKLNQEFDEIESYLEVNFTANNSVFLFGKANVPVTIPLHQGYYMGNTVYYIVTDSSDPNYSEIITKNQGWKVNLAPLLANATKDSLSKTYTFTNGVPGDGVLGFQGEIFTSTPEQSDDYSALTSHVQVTWNARTIPFILDSEKEMLIAEKQGFVDLTPINIVLNMPQIVWPEGQMPVKANKTITDDTPFVGGQVLDINLTNMTTTFVAHRGWDSEGNTIYFIVTDATPIGPALSMGVPHVQKNAALITNPAASDMFHFMNGVKGSGPLGFQQGIASTSIGSGLYSPMSRIYFIEWNDLNSTAFIKTKNTIDEFEKEGLINVNLARPMAADHIVNSPFVNLFDNK